MSNFGKAHRFRSAYYSISLDDQLLITNNMRSFIHDDFCYRQTPRDSSTMSTRQKQPIIDYHCHLDPEYIALSLLITWDKYGWRVPPQVAAMRTNGTRRSTVPVRRLPTGRSSKSGRRRHYTMRNPLYHWTHLELKRCSGLISC